MNMKINEFVFCRFKNPMNEKLLILFCVFALVKTFLREQPVVGTLFLFSSLYESIRILTIRLIP